MWLDNTAQVHFACKSQNAAEVKEQKIFHSAIINQYTVLPCGVCVFLQLGKKILYHSAQTGLPPEGLPTYCCLMDTENPAAGLAEKCVPTRANTS